MNDNIFSIFAVIGILAVLSIGWNHFFMAYLKKNQAGRPGGRTTEESEKVLRLLRPSSCLKNFIITCPVLLNNSDDEISAALDYVRPSRYAGQLLEKLNEQAGV